MKGGNCVNLFFAEWKNILRNRKVFIPILAIVFIPILYAGMFLWAFWDPYDQLEDLPVAIVNIDEGASYEEEHLQLGNDLVQNLKENRKFKFDFVSQQAGYDGLEDGTYYMVVEIPKDFSKNATTLLDDQPEKLHLRYIPNEGSNFLSAQIGDSAVKEIKSAISKEVTSTYAETIFEKITTMADGFDTASEGASELNDGASKLKDGSVTLKDNLETLASKSLEFQQGVNKVQSGSGELNDGAKKLADGVNQLSEGSDKLLAASKQVKDGSQELSSGMNQVNQGLQEINEKVPSLVAGTNELNEGLVQFHQQFPPQMAAGIQAQLKEATVSMNNGLDELQNVLSEELAAGLTEKISTEQSEQMTAIFSLLEKNNVDPAIISGIQQQVMANAASKEEMQAQLENGISEGLNTGFTQYKSAVNERMLSSGNKLEDSIKAAIDPTFSTLENGLSKINDNQVTLQDGINQLADGSKSVNQGATDLKTGQAEYVDQFTLFNEKLHDAQAGGNKLVSGASNLNSGISQLLEGSVKISDGSTQLAEGSKELTSGTGKLADGTSELYEKLGDAAEEAGSVQATTNTFDMIGEPVDVSKEGINKVPNYGTGFAPYFLSLGLFVGALLISIVYTLKIPTIHPKSGFSWFIGKFGVIAIVGVCQAIVADVILLVGLGLEVTSVPMFVFLSIVISLTFMSLIQLLVTTLGDPGRFIAVLILIFQLTTSAGTFPLEMIPKALQPIHAFLPMSYTVSAFKAVISSGDMTVVWNNIFILLGYMLVFVIMTLTYFIIKHKKQAVSASENGLTA